LRRASVVGLAELAGTCRQLIQTCVEDARNGAISRQRARLTRLVTYGRNPHYSARLLSRPFLKDSPVWGILGRVRYSRSGWKSRLISGVARVRSVDDRFLNASNAARSILTMTQWSVRERGGAGGVFPVGEFSSGGLSRRSTARAGAES